MNFELATFSLCRDTGLLARDRLSLEELLSY